MPQHSSQGAARSGLTTEILKLTVEVTASPLSCPPVKYERIKFLVIALKNSVEVYAWAPKPYHKFMAFKVIPASATSMFPGSERSCTCLP
jgi:hypothetical protein